MMLTKDGNQLFGDLGTELKEKTIPQPWLFDEKTLNKDNEWAKAIEQGDGFPPVRHVRSNNVVRYINFKQRKAISG